MKHLELVQFLAWCYVSLLRLYPRHHWEEYGQERAWVFDRMSEEAARRGPWALIELALRELSDLPRSILHEYWRASRGQKMNATIDECRHGQLHFPTHERATWSATLAAVAPFSFLSLWAIVNALPGSMPESGLSLLWGALAAGYVIVLVGFTAGWVKDFPRWSYAYILSVPLLSLLAGAIRMNSTESLVWRSLIFLGVAAAIAVVLTRSLRPLTRLVQGVREDWTRLSFALYSLMPIVVWIAFDEISDRFELPFMVALNLILAGGALAYMRSVGPLRRALVLVDALALSWLATAIGNAVYWHGRWVGRRTKPLHWYEVSRPSLIALFVLVAFLVSPSLLGLLRSMEDNRPSRAA